MSFLGYSASLVVEIIEKIEGDYKSIGINIESISRGSSNILVIN